MPKFWSRDYLSEAVQEQRALVERMSLAPPTHIEVVDCYAHKGEVDNVHCTMPWILFSPDPDLSLQSHTPSLVEPLQSELRSLWGSSGPLVGGHVAGDDQLLVGGVSREGVERYGCEESGSESLFSDDEEIETGASPSTLTQEIDSALDRMMSSGGRGQTSVSGEEFPAENLQGWAHYTTPEVAELYLEDHECPPHLSSLLTALPTVSDLVARLKPKLISDPLINSSTSKPHTYIQICRSDFEFLETESIPGEAPAISDLIAASRELDHFSREVVGDVAIDLVLELHMASPGTQPLVESPSGQLSRGLLPPLPQLPSPVENEGDCMEPGEELRVLVSEVREEAERRQGQQLHYTSPPDPPTATFTAEFLKLNTADVSCGSQDSGIGHAVLESPCVPMLSPPSHSSLPSQLAHLHTLPVSPYSPKTLGLLSPLSEDRLLAHIKEDCRTFDSVLALKLPYTGPGSHLDVIWKSYKPLHSVEECCKIHPINLTGDFELALPWDPLTSSYHMMAAVQRRIVCLECPVEPVATEPSKTTEEFVKDSTVETLGDKLGDAQAPMEVDVPSIHSAPVGYLTNTRQPPVPTEPVADTRLALASLWDGGDKEKNEQQLLQFTDSTSALELFIMMRSGQLSPEIENNYTPNNTDVEVAGKELNGEAEDPLNNRKWVTSPTLHSVSLNRDYQVVLGKVAHYSAPMVDSLRPHCLPVANGAPLDPDDVKFFLKQQQKCLADAQGSKEESVLLQSCKLAACLYVLVSLADGITNINLATGLRRFSFLSEKYEELIGSGLDAAGQGLSDLQLREQEMPHPKLNKLVSVVDTWKNNRKQPREKAVVVVGKDFSTVSGDILDFLKSISDLKCCVFSFACESPGNPLYLETLEERLQYYDCLVVPLTSIATTFPWEKVGLLIEYHPLGGALFPGNQAPPSLRLHQWAVLQTVQDTSATSLTNSGAVAAAFQHTLVASENITGNSKLLQLLESRFNMVLISREYEPLKKRLGPSFSHADLIVDHSTGVVVHPLTLLSSDSGFHLVSTRAAALSLQYQRLWVLLYAESEKSYPYGGSTPLNLARLHASVAHYSLQQDDYQVKIRCLSDCVQVAELVRTVSEDTRKMNEGTSDQEWCDREWIPDDMEMHEKFLLGFPCINSFSALMMLRKCSLRQLLVLNITQLQEIFPWLPHKVAKFFMKMCNVKFQENLPVAVASPVGSSNQWQESGVYYEEAPANIDLNDSLQYTTGDTYYSPNAVSHDMDPDKSGLFPTKQWSYEEDTSVRGVIPTAHRSPVPSNSHVEHNESDFNSFLPPSTHHSGQMWSNTELSNSVETNTLLSDQPTSGFATTEWTNNQPAEDNPPLPHISLFDSHPTAPTVVSGAAQTDLSSSNHFSVSDNLAREYYGNNPTPPRLLTSGMVRRMPSQRQPVKSLGVDVGVASPPPKGIRPRLQANDRALAISSGGGRYGDREGVVVRERTDRWGGVGGRLEDMMSFHSRQSSAAVAERSMFPNTTSGAATTYTGNQRIRQKRPLPRSPIFDCLVPINTMSPQSRGDSSLFASPNVSLGSVKLSPLRKRRLVYKRLPSSLDGQTKLAFE